MRWIAAWILAAAVYLARAEQARPQGPATESRTATRATEPSACGQECLLERMAKFLDAARTGRLEDRCRWPKTPRFARTHASYGWRSRPGRR